MASVATIAKTATAGVPPTSVCLSLMDHSADVAACFASLLGYETLERRCGESLLRTRMAHLAGLHDLSPIQCARLTVLTGLHDFGKANRGFQRRIRGDTSGLQAGHVSEAVGLLCRVGDDRWRDRLFQVFDFGSLGAWFEEQDEDPICFLAAALSHHGSPVRPNEQATDVLWGDADGYAPLEEVGRLVHALRSWLPDAWKIGGEPLPKVPALQHAFCGVLQLADWIGSDTRFFPFPDGRNVPGSPHRWTWSCRQARQAVSEIGFGTAAARAYLGSDPGFHRLFVKEPRSSRPMQRAVGEMPLPGTASVTLIEDETGAGKTEAALWYFLRLFAAGQVDGMYFALPTRAAALQIFERVRAAWRAACGPDAPAVLCAVPGYLRADDAEGRRLPGFEVQWNDEPGDYKRHRYWAAEHPKRYLAGCVVVGTIDQVLLSALAVRHHHLRAAPVLRHLLVVDEVHASDTYMSAVLQQVLRRQMDAGGHVLLLSATLGACATTRLLSPAQRSLQVPSLDEASKAPYPRLSLRSGDLRSITVLSTGRRREIDIRCEPHIQNPEIISRTALAHAAAGARVLIIRNTVTNCIAVWRALEAVPNACLGFSVQTPQGLIRCPHHGRFAREDRQLLDGGLGAVFGKAALRGPTGCVLVATQTVEQSLDIDADLLITDLSPGDVLLQRLGRLHRHDRERPAGYQQPIAIVLTPDVEDLSAFLGDSGLTKSPAGTLGFGSVYDDLRVLQSTWEALSDQGFRPLRVPDHNRALVERCTHPEALSALDARSPAWQRHGLNVLGATIQNRQLAGLNLLPWDVPFAVWKQETLNRLGVLGQLERKVSTRLGLEDRRLTLPDGTLSPFGQAIRELSLPGHWFARRPLPIQEAPDEIAKEEDGSLAFRVGDWRFRYSACGLERVLEDKAP